MLRYFKALSLHRGAWFLLFISAFAIEGVALYFQHVMGLVPCVMCIYQRLALLAVLAAGLVGMLAPKLGILRWSALLLGLFGAVKGLMLAIEHTDYQMNFSPFKQCPIKVEFPATLPLNEWFPNLFEAGGLCSKIQWQFLGYSMPQWLIVVFGIYLALFVLLLASQLVKSKPAHRNLFH